MSDAKKTTKPKKPKSVRKDSAIRVRVTDAQRAAFDAAAEREGLDVSSWLRMLGLRETR